jgi:predicted ATPase/class 3 adenylate cyclase
MRQLPTGTVTLLFTDIEGSTRLLQELGRERYVRALEQHRRLLREAFVRFGGVEVEVQGDSFHFAFATATDAVRAAAAGQLALVDHDWPDAPIRVRMGIHTGAPVVSGGLYAGLDVHRAARVMSVGHGGQVLISQATRDLLDGVVELRDLGLHRLKDLLAPERIYQLGEGEFPPLKSLNQTNLPVQPAPFIGRERELGELLDLLDDHRLVTLTGAGGSGKTRLALQAAAELVDEHPDGVWFVSLAAVTDPDLVEPTIMQVVGAREDLRQHLRGKRLLLLLDNLEQLLPGVAPVVSGLGTKVLATSRERLNVLGEQEYPVPTLPPAEAVALFNERARQLKPSFEPDLAVNEIADRLDGLPLALELAAARVKVLTPVQILERLGHSLDLLTTGASDAPERQRTLRATIEWSYDLLKEPEQRLFVRLAVFRGSFDLDAAESIVAAELDTLGSLVDKSLLRQTEAGRFFTLEAIREYAEELFTEMDNSRGISRKHADHYLDLAERLKQDASAGRQVDSYAAFDADHDNLRAALASFVSESAVEQEFRLLNAVAGYWYVRGHLREGNRHVDSALGRREAAPPPLRAEVLAIASDFARIFAGSAELAASYAEQSLAVAREVGDPAVVRRALHELGESAHALGDLPRAKELYHEAIALEREAGRSGASDLGNLGDVALTEGNFEEAAARSAEAEELWLAEGRTDGAATARFNRASALLHLGRPEDARPLLNETLRDAGELGHVEGIAWCLLAVAALVATRDSSDAARLLGAAEAILDEIGAQIGGSELRLRDAVVARFDETQATRLREEGRQMSRDEAVALARQYLD